MDFAEKEGLVVVRELFAVKNVSRLNCYPRQTEMEFVRNDLFLFLDLTFTGRLVRSTGEKI